MRRSSLFLVFLLVTGAVPARADWHLGAGITDRIDGETTGVVTVAWSSAERHPWVLMLGRLGERDGVENGPIDDTWFGSVSKRLHWRRWFVQAGIAMSDADNEVLSRHWQFHTAAGWASERWTLSLQHLSNADTGGRNRGESFLLLEYGF